MPHRTKSHSWISLIHAYQLLVRKIPKYLLIIQAVELICQTSSDAAVFGNASQLMTSMQKRIIVVLNSRFVEVTKNQNRDAKTFIIMSLKH